MSTSLATTHCHKVGLSLALKTVLVLPCVGLTTCCNFILFIYLFFNPCWHDGITCLIIQWFLSMALLLLTASSGGGGGFNCRWEISHSSGMINGTLTFGLLCKSMIWICSTEVRSNDFRRHWGNGLTVLTFQESTTILYTVLIHILSLRLIWKEVPLAKAGSSAPEPRGQSGHCWCVVLLDLKHAVQLFWHCEVGQRPRNLAAGMEFYIHMVLLVINHLLKVQSWDLFFSLVEKLSIKPFGRPESNTFRPFSTQFYLPASTTDWM